MSTITIKHFASTEPLAITREWIETMKNMPERAAVTTELFKEQFTRFENQRIEFADLCDAWYMTCFDNNQELIDEVMSYTPTLARKRKQWDADFASAKANMMRRAGYDASLLKRIFNLFR